MAIHYPGSQSILQSSLVLISPDNVLSIYNSGPAKRAGRLHPLCDDGDHIIRFLGIKHGPACVGHHHFPLLLP